MVGEFLKEERGKRGFSLEDIAAMTHIGLDYLRDIENGNFQRIPSEIYVKGYLKAYAKILGISEDNILALYCEDRPDHDEECKETGEPDRQSHFNKYSMIVSGVILSLLVIFILFKFDVIKSGNPGNGQTAEEDERRGRLGSQNLRIIANDTTWLMLVTDNERVEEYILKKGDVLVREGLRGFHIKIGNAGGVTMFLNNENIGRLGGRGEVVKVSIPEEFKLDKKFKYLFQARKPLT